MSLVKFILFVSFIYGVSCECEHEWLTFSDANFFKSQAITAGEFKRGFPAYVGQGKNPKGRSVPGRIQHERSSLKLFYPANKKIETSTRDVKFLRQNPEYNYAWVEADSRKCIDNGVMVDESFYIGRTEEGDFAYIGQVNVGERLLHYETATNTQASTNTYQILTCTVNSQAENYKECTKNLTNCEAAESELKKVNDELSADIRLLKSDKQNCILVRDLYNQSNEMLKGELKRKTDELSQCTSGGSSSCSSSPDIAELQNEIQTLKRQLTFANNEINNLKNQRSSERSSPLLTGVDGCIMALGSVTQFNPTEETRLLQVIREKLNQDEITD